MGISLSCPDSDLGYLYIQNHALRLGVYRLPIYVRELHLITFKRFPMCVRVVAYSKRVLVTTQQDQHCDNKATCDGPLTGDLLVDYLDNIVTPEMHQR